MDFIRFFLILIVPGLIATWLYTWITHCKCKGENCFYTALIFDLLIYIINITGLYFFKGVCTMTALLAEFECLSFTRRYALLSIFVGLILATIFGCIRKFCFWWKKCD